MTILVTGAGGLLGTALKAFLPEAVYVTRAQCDVTHRPSVTFAMRDYKPDIIVHCAAATAPMAFPNIYLENTLQGTINVVRECFYRNIRLIYPSTDYVGARREDDPVKPFNHYAKTKLAGELATQMLERHLIVRGSWYDRLDYVEAATDAYTSKIHVTQAAEWIAKLALSDHTGIVNIGGPRRSIYDIAREQNPDVHPVLRKDLGCACLIPEDVALDTSKFESWGIA